MYDNFVALATGSPKAKVPYASFTDKVCGFPEDLKFGPPSLFSSQALQKILDKADEISFSKSKYEISIRMIVCACVYNIYKKYITI